jgi:hypothetical protein
MFSRIEVRQEQFVVFNQMREWGWWSLWIDCTLVSSQWKIIFCFSCVRFYSFLLCAVYSFLLFRFQFCFGSEGCLSRFFLVMIAAKLLLSCGARTPPVLHEAAPLFRCVGVVWLFCCGQISIFICWGFLCWSCPIFAAEFSSSWWPDRALSSWFATQGHQLSVGLTKIFHAETFLGAAGGWFLHRSAWGYCVRLVSTGFSWLLFFLVLSARQSWALPRTGACGQGAIQVLLPQNCSWIVFLLALCPSDLLFLPPKLPARGSFRCMVWSQFPLRWSAAHGSTLFFTGYFFNLVGRGVQQSCSPCFWELLRTPVGSVSSDFLVHRRSWALVWFSPAQETELLLSTRLWRLFFSFSFCLLPAVEDRPLLLHSFVDSRVQLFTWFGFTQWHSGSKLWRFQPALVLVKF